jgi:glycosyltransferase involved in cell wall biosynthesis
VKIIPLTEGDPLISVLVPAYNRADTLEKCVRSAIDNGYERLQIIIADNGSTDETLAIANKLKDEDARVQVIAQGNNLGPVPNWRSCLARATGEYVHWLWSDDWVEPNFYRTLIDGLRREGANVAVCACKITSPLEGWWCIRHSNPDMPRTGQQLIVDHLKNNLFAVSPAAYLLPIDSVQNQLNRDIPQYGKINCHGRAIGPDLLMILTSLLDDAPVFVCPEPLVNFRSHSSSITVTSGGDILVTHYSFARLWWSRENGINIKKCIRDIARLLLNRQFISVFRLLIGK